MRKGFYLLVVGADKVETLDSILQQAGVKGIMVTTPQKAVQLDASVTVCGYEMLTPTGWLTFEQKHILDGKVKACWAKFQ